MSEIIFDTAKKEDIAELVRLRIAYMIDDNSNAILTDPPPNIIVEK